MKKKWVFLSPHLDDAVYSCGGLIADQTRRGSQVEIWSICAGDPPAGPLTLFAKALHARWKTGREAVAVRRAEDRLACGLVAAQPRHFDLPDSVYRRDPDTGKAFYRSTGDIFGQPAEKEISAIRERFMPILGPLLDGQERLVLPLGIGGHVDHQLVRMLGERLSPAPWYYADVPYALDASRDWGALLPGRGGWRIFPLSAQGFRRWFAAAAAYASQLSTFWEDEWAMEASFAAHRDRFNGIPLWQPQ